MLTECPMPQDFGWLRGHVHEIAMPLVSTQPPGPSPLSGPLPCLANHIHGHPPGAPDARWLNAKLFTHPDRYNEIVADHLPRLLATVDQGTAWWFVRYRSPNETDHLRLRLRANGQHGHGALSAAMGTWADELCRDALLARLVFDAYAPEIGRYGTGYAMEAAEEVFATDSRAVAAVLRHLPADVHLTALVVAGMTAIVEGFLGDQATDWLIDHPARAALGVDRSVAQQSIRLAHSPNSLLTQTQVALAWRERQAALGRYRASLPESMDVDAVLESLLHMHHNRVIGMDREDEAICRRLLRHAAMAARARQQGAGR